MASTISVNSKNAVNKPSLLKAILVTGFIAGTLDMSGAIVVWSFVLQKVTPVQILQGIASGVFGKEAFSGNPLIAASGVLFHYVIAFSFTILFFLLYPRIPFLRNQKVISGLLYGIFAWAFMNYIVLPISNVHMSPFKWSNAIISFSILMVCLGLPISILTNRYYNKKEMIKA